jgi:cysteine desulfurase/selenocysteine lyase
MEGVHAHDVVEMANTFGLALRGGHHCNQPLMKKLGTPASARASFYLYTTPGEIDRLAEALSKIHAYFNAG